MDKPSIYDEDRSESVRYSEADIGMEVLLPITRLGFDSLLDVSSKLYDLPVDDKMKMVLAGYIHHIKNEQCTTTIKTIADVLYKSVSNSLTWTIDQEIKAKGKKELEEAIKKEKELAEINSNGTNVLNLDLSH